MVLPIRLWGIFLRGVLPAAIDFLAQCYTTVCVIWGILRCYRYCGLKPSEMSCLVRHVLYTCSTGRWGGGGYRVMIIMRILHCLLYAATAHVVWPERIQLVSSLLRRFYVQSHENSLQINEIPASFYHGCSWKGFVTCWNDLCKIKDFLFAPKILSWPKGFSAIIWLLCRSFGWM